MSQRGSPSREMGPARGSMEEPISPSNAPLSLTEGPRDWAAAAASASARDACRRNRLFPTPNEPTSVMSLATAADAAAEVKTKGSI